MNDLTLAQRRRIRMLNYWAFLVGAFLSLILAGLATVYSWWMPAPFLAFSAWLFRLMHLSGFKEVPDSVFSLPRLLDLFSRRQDTDNNN